MYLNAATDNFYEMTPTELWGTSIKPEFLTTKQLDKEIEAGRATWKRLHPPKRGWAKYKKLAIVVAVAVSAGAAAAAIAAASAATATTAAAATAAATTASAGTAAAATTAAAASGGAITTAGAMSAIKASAGYLMKGAAIYSKVKGKKSPAALMAAADAVANSKDFVDAGEKALDYYLKQTGQEITDKKQRALIRERLKREQALQAERIRRMAALEANREATGNGINKYLPLLIPAGILAVGVL